SSGSHEDFAGDRGMPLAISSRCSPSSALPRSGWTSESTDPKTENGREIPLVEDPRETADELDDVVRERARPVERVRERGDLDAAATLHREHAGASGDRQVRRGVPKARRAKTVDGGRGPAPLQMPEHDLTSLDAGALLDVPREDRADRALVEADMAERVAVDRGLRLEAVDLGGLGHDDEDVEVPERAPALHRARDVVARHPDLGDEDQVRAAGETAERRDPAGVAAHGLDD